MYMTPGGHVIRTTFSTFLKNYQTRPLLPVAAEILADLETPVSTYFKTTAGTYRFLLESVEQGAQRGRYSIIGDRPLAILKSRNGRTLFQNLVTRREETSDGNPLDVLQSYVKTYTTPGASVGPFYEGGFFGYLGYDSVRHIERLPNQALDDLQVPDFHLFIPQRIIVFDNLLNRLTILHFITPSGQAEQDYLQAIEELKKVEWQILHGERQNNPGSAADRKTDSTTNMDRADFEAMVAKAQSHIRRGDIFQVVLSRRIQRQTSAPAIDIYRALRVINPSPYMFFMEMGSETLLGSSPETLVKLEDGRVTVKPIAGTRKRGANEKEDHQLMEELLADPKERAEHTMLVDLGRNDVGRVSAYGTVKVEELMAIEKYSHVIHIVSTVTGELQAGLDAIDVYRAAFPAGTVSGAPKVRAMEIIEELEPTRRGLYAGAVGYFAFNGNMDVCIAIRTIWIRGQEAMIQTGAGIVADSVPVAEFEETENKARALMRAIEYAEGGLS
jgi:anthranilate synthase component I